MARGSFIEKEIIYESCSLEEKREFEYLKCMLKEKELYKIHRLTIKEVGKKINMSPKRISVLINSFTDGNFNDLVNKIRVEDFKNKAQKEKYSNHSILGIATDAGFSSKAAFYRAFKKFESMTPTEFLKDLKR
ncbi:helix-turn-helix domain-containing protein [Tenacibaculum sp. 190524A02b]|uniref:helix-turn-helix domain-containing protein n=1 Tax=Tenacibaculum vairaonense TaxID=3137860 RepID=UPI0032B1C2EC